MDNIEESSIKEAIEILSDKTNKLIEAKILAAFALKKELPQKPRKITRPILISDGWEYECPACGCAVGENKNAEGYTQKDDYCPSCGQKLDWNN